MPSYTPNEVRRRLASYPRENLIQAPTPLQKLGNLTHDLGGPDIYIKRDDLTGLAFGGNKSRKLEYIIADALKKKADTIITWASLQSNWCLQTAAAARRFGIAPILILFRTYDLPDLYDGNLLLDFLLDADIRIQEAEKGRVVTAAMVEKVMEEMVEEVKASGRTPYIAPIGGSMVGGDMDIPLGAMGYMEDFFEIAEQFEAIGNPPDTIILASGSGGTQAGLIVAVRALGMATRIIGISVSEEKEAFGRDVLTICRDTVSALDLDIRIVPDDVIVMDDYIREGYGIVDAEVSEVVRRLALSEGIFIDPVYTGKALVGLIDLVRKGDLNSGEKVVFMHTGGTAALFPNKHLITKYLG